MSRDQTKAPPAPGVIPEKATRAGEPGRSAGQCCGLALEPLDGRHTILEDFPSLTWLAEKDGSRCYFNKTWLDFTGSTLERETAEGWTHGVHPDDLHRLKKNLKQHFQLRKPFEINYRLRRSDGQWRWITDLGRPLRGPRGGFTGFIGCCFDITERVEQQQALQEAKARAEAADMAKNVFLANISHEVRTPLNGIMGMLDALADSSPTAEQSDFIDTAISCSKQLLAVLNDILDLARIEAGNLTLHPSPVNVGELIRKGSELYSFEARNLGISLTVDVDAELDSSPLPVDEVRLRQILYNLVGNALKFTGFGGKIAVSAFLTNNVPVRRLVLAVSDTGIGIPRDKLARIFDPFVQAEDSLTRQYRGAGLGLSIVRKLILMMEGEICVGSRPGSGTDLSLSIPVKIGSGTLCHGDALASQTPPLLPVKALLAEDDKVNQIAARRMLEKLGMTVSCARNGKQALELVTAGAFDIVFMDVQMPVMDGLAATRAIRALEASSPGRSRVAVVAMTAHAMKGDREMCLEAGMDEYVPKPLEKSAVLRAALAALAKRAAP